MTDEVTAPTGLDLLPKLVGLETQIAELHAAHVGLREGLRLESHQLMEQLRADIAAVRASVQLVLGDLAALTARVDEIASTHSVKHEMAAMRRSGPHRVWGAQA